MRMPLSLASPARRALLSALVVATLMTGFIAFQIESRASILRNGTEVLLRTAPVDPRDLMRGDYVILSYDIGRIPLELLSADKGKSGWGSVWVRLKPADDGYWQAAEASFEPLYSKEGSAVIRSQTFDRRDPAEAYGDYRLDYGIERFYVPEGEGLAIEEARNEQRVSVVVRVSASGVAQIRSLMLDGTAIYDEPLY